MGKNIINRFEQKDFYLSNFYPIKVEYNGIIYLNSEAAFQAQKTINQRERRDFSILDPTRAKNLGRKINLREDWEEVKDQIMYEIVKEKFLQNVYIKKKLLGTGDAILIEGNTWGDTYWGQVNGKGQNKLGKILMKIRSELKEEK